jgi:hypothetical protein
MEILKKVLTGLALMSLLVSLASCCCVGGSNSDNNDDTDIVDPNEHNEGTGGNT